MTSIYIDAKSTTEREATMRLYGAIGERVDGDIFAMDLAALDDAGYDVINLRVNSPGGDVFQGMSIVSTMLSMTTPVYVYVDGIAASMGAVIAVAADKVYMMDFAKMMIHDPYFAGAKDSEITAKQRKMLAKIRDMLELVLSRRSKTSDEIGALMREETWLSAEEAMAVGLCDEVTTSKHRKLASATPDQIVAAVNEEYFNKNKIEKMNQVTLSAEASVALGISATTDAGAINTAIMNIVAENKKLTDKVNALTLAATERAEKEAKAMVASAVADGKIDATKVADWERFAKENFDLAKASLNAIPAKRSISAQVKTITTSTGIPEDRADWRIVDWLKKDSKGLAKIKAEQPEVYEVIRQVGR